MATRNKYNIINNIEDDAPFGSINFCTISFITPEKVDATKYLDIYGFKITNGYNTMELADADALKIKEKNKNHDVYICELGKLCAWDDATKSDSLQYDNKKLNDLETTRREHAAKIKLMSEQYKNEFKPMPDMNKKRKDTQMKKIQKQLYERGLISKDELDMIKDDPKPAGLIKQEALAKKRMDIEMEKVFETDYLDENVPVGLKYGCFTIYSPKHIKGLKTLCFKIRGLFQTIEETTKRVNKLGALYKNDRIYTFEIGKWCAFSCTDNLPVDTQLKRLNYAMKCYLDNLEIEKDEFEKRKAEKLAEAGKDNATLKEKNLQEKLQEKQATKNTSTTVSTPVVSNKPVSMGTEDDIAIQALIDYLNDDEVSQLAAEKNKHVKKENPIAIDI